MGVAVGIDLGTTNSCVAVVQANRARVVVDHQQRRIYPSVVSFLPDGNVVCGHEARERQIVDAPNTVYSFKRLIGRNLNTPEMQRVLRELSYKVSVGTEQVPSIRVQGRDISLPEVSALMLKHLRETCKRMLGLDLKDAVITVPANFNDVQRSLTKVAARIAGFNVLRVLNEPTAAALAYGFGGQRSERIAIYDFGGGTFDITIVELANDIFEVLSTAGNTFLGGDDFDKKIMEIIRDDFQKAHGIDLFANQMALQRIRSVSEKVKCQLSSIEEVQATLREIAVGPDGPIDYNFKSTRSAFEKLIEGFVEESLQVCGEALKLAGIDRTGVDNLVLVGGTTRIPYIRQRVSEFFGLEPKAEINPDEVVAIGAAIQAFSLTGEQLPEELPSPEAPKPLPRGMPPIVGTVPKPQGKPVPMAAPAVPPMVPKAAAKAPPIPTPDLKGTMRGVADPGAVQALRGAPGKTPPPPPVIPAGTTPFKVPTAPLPKAAAEPVEPGPFDIAPADLPKLARTIAQKPPVPPPASVRSKPPLPPVPSGPPAPPPPLAEPFAEDEDFLPTPFEEEPGLPAPLEEPGLPAPLEEPGLPAPVAALQQDHWTPEPPEPPVPPLAPPEPSEPPVPPLAPPEPLPFEMPAAQGTLSRPVVDPTYEPFPHEPMPESLAGAGADPFSDPLFDIPVAPPDPGTLSGARVDATFPKGPPVRQMPVATPTQQDELFGNILADLPLPGAEGDQVTGVGMPLPELQPAPPEPGTLDDFGKIGAAGEAAYAVPATPARAASTLLLDVTPRALGLATAGGFCDTIIDRNAAIPVEQSRLFTTSADDQTQVSINVYQGESRRVEENTKLGEVLLTDLRPAPRGTVKILVTFEIDTDGILGVSARNQETGVAQSTRIVLSGGMAEDEVEALVEKYADNG